MPTTGRLLLPYPGSTDSADVPRDVQALADRVEALTAWIRQADFAPNIGAFFPGDLKFTAAALPASGWLVCDGTSYLRTAYPELFAAMGGAASVWGLPDGTHFRVPNLAGRSPMGAGLSTAIGAAVKNVGDLVGEERHVLVAGELPSHTHPFSDTAPYNYFAPVAAGGQSNYGGTQSINSNTLPNSPNGSSHNTLGPVAVVNVFVKT
jgi:microcystin-dependent protein